MRTQMKTRTRKIIETYIKPNRLYADIADRTLDEELFKIAVDIYVAGLIMQHHTT